MRERGSANHNLCCLVPTVSSLALLAAQSVQNRTQDYFRRSLFPERQSECFRHWKNVKREDMVVPVLSIWKPWPLLSLCAPTLPMCWIVVFKLCCAAAPWRRLEETGGNGAGLEAGAAALWKTSPRWLFCVSRRVAEAVGGVAVEERWA